MPRYIRFMSIAVYMAAALSLSACSTISSAYDSVATTVTDAFKSDDAKK